MADNPSIDPGTTPSVPIEGDDIGSGVIRQGVVVSFGAKDASNRVTSTNPFPVGLGTASLGAAVQRSVTSTASTVLSAGTYRSVMLRNLSSSASSVFIGPATVTATTGMEIKPGEFLSFGPGECPSNLVQGICVASGTATLIVQASS